MGGATAVSVPVAEVPALTYAIPAIALGGGVVAANVLGFGLGGLGTNRTHTLAVIAVFLGVTAGLWATLALWPKGQLRVADGSFRLERFLLSDQRIDLARTTVEVRRWEQGMSDLPVGVQVILDDGRATASVGVASADLYREHEGAGAQARKTPPMVRIEAGQLAALTAALAAGGAPLPAGLGR